MIPHAQCVKERDLDDTQTPDAIVSITITNLNLNQIPVCKLASGIISLNFLLSKLDSCLCIYSA